MKPKSLFSTVQCITYALVRKTNLCFINFMLSGLKVFISVNCRSTNTWNFRTFFHNTIYTVSYRS